VTTAESFLADIIANPADDAVRLIYADWLSEHDQEERGEFIRVQIELAKPAFASMACACQIRYNGTLVYRCELCTLVKRERELFQTYRLVPDRWLAGLPVSQFDWGLPNWNRGFLAQIHLLCAVWIQHGPALVLQHPIERVELSDKRPGRFEPHSASPYWRFFMLGTGDPQDGDLLPEELWEAIHCPVGREWPDWEFPTEQAAQSALSKGCIQWAKEKAHAQSR
jgi:uncharacterized protein (TIGR02996 family)